jgi:beta-mannosidase
LYEEERFFDLCDQYGILVWQDFIFSCSIYPLDAPDFLENVRIEIEENIKRLRHRASLALWCGNNEMEWGWESWGWQKHPMEDQLPELVEQFPALGFLMEAVGERDLLPDWEVLKDAYVQFFYHTLPEWVDVFDPDTPYWPSSPTSGVPFHDTNSQKQGDAHYWDVWHGRKPFTAYRGTYPRFMSEFGFQAFPAMETIEYYTAPEDRNLTSYIMEHHQRGNHGNGLIIAQMTETFRMPKDFTAWIYLSLVLQAEGIRYGVEHWRRNVHRVSGTLYWQLNDCWPVASWASIDYFGRWKALHYLARRFYAPVLLSIEDNPPVMEVHLASDRTEPWQGTLKWSLENLEGEVLDSDSIDVEVNPLSATLVGSFDFNSLVTPENKRDVVFICELWRADGLVSTSVGTFAPNKHLSFVEPDLDVNTQQIGDELVITLSAKSMARFVELKLSGADIVFSDNYFDVPAGREVKVSCPIPDGWSQADAENALQVYSLYDSYA